MSAPNLMIPAFLALALAGSLANADEHWNDDQKAVWDVVSASWEDDAGETGKWPGDYLHESAHAWSAGWPAPRDSKSYASWTRFEDDSAEVLKYEIFPMKIVVVGDTAVAYYGAVLVTADHDGARERTTEGLVETLARTDDGWKFVGLTSFDAGGGD